MNPKISELLDRIQQMELEIELEMKRKRAELQADFEETRVRFEREVLEQQRRFKTGVISYLLTANLMSVLTAPVIYALFVPILLLDLSFISLRLVLPALVACAAEGADLLPMVKPQFEVGKERVGKGREHGDRGG